MNTIKNKNYIYLAIFFVSVLVPFSYLRAVATSTATTTTPVEAVDPTAGIAWSGGECSASVAQMKGMQKSLKKVQVALEDTQKENIELEQKIQEYTVPGVGPFSLKMIPSKPTAGGLLRVTATLTSTSSAPYTITLLKDGKSVLNIATKEGNSKTKDVLKQVTLPAKLRAGKYTLQMVKDADVSIKSTIDFDLQ